MWHSKYKNKKVTTDEGVFDSKKEYHRWVVLKDMQERGLISDLQRQVDFPLLPKQILIVPRKAGKRHQKCELPVKYTADFVYTEDGRQVVEDVKGMRPKEYILKRKLMKFLLNIEVREI